MAAPDRDIQELRTRLESSRWRIHQGLHAVEDKLNVSRKIRTEFKEHPLRWVAVSAGLGLVAAKVVPMLFGGKKQGFLGRLFSPLLRVAATAAIPLVAKKASAWMAEKGLSLPGITPNAAAPAETPASASSSLNTA